MRDLLVPFSRPTITEAEQDLVMQRLLSGRLAGGDADTQNCQEWLEKKTGCSKVLLTTSATAALEMAAILLDLKPGDEVILPSFTFSSSANAIALRGAVPVFVDSRPDTMNMDERKIVKAITPRTMAIMPVHYAGVGCDMEVIDAIAKLHDLAVIEDAAQAVCADYNGRPLGSFGDFAAFSFHISKNISCGEGGALLINDEEALERAEILWEKGTNRAQFMRGQVDKYTWQDIGSSFLPAELLSSLLLAQLNRAEDITAARRRLWQHYHDEFAELEEEGLIRRPSVPGAATHNGHIYFVLLNEETDRSDVIGRLRALGIAAQFHYVPLHSAPAGLRYGRTGSTMDVVDSAAAQLLRLPLFPDMTEGQLDYVIHSLKHVLRDIAYARTGTIRPQNPTGAGNDTAGRDRSRLDTGRPAVRPLRASA